MLIFMKAFFWINEQTLCRLSEVFLIIWELFSLHGTRYQKFIKTFFSPAVRLLVFLAPHWYSPLHVCIYLCRLPQRSSEVGRNSEWSLEKKNSEKREAARPHGYSSPPLTHQALASGCSSELMRLTIQLKRRPYRALDMASRTSAALSTVLVRMMVSPLVTTHWEVSASWSSSGPMLRRDAAERKTRLSHRERVSYIMCNYNPNTSVPQFHLQFLCISLFFNGGNVPKIYNKLTYIYQLKALCFTCSLCLINLLLFAIITI